MASSEGGHDHRTFSQGLQVKFRRITGPEHSLPLGNYTAVQVPQTQERHIHQPPFSMETSRRRPRGDTASRRQTARGPLPSTPPAQNHRRVFSGDGESRRVKEGSSGDEE